MPPEVVIVSYTPYGRLELAFDQLMLVPDLVSKLLIMYTISESSRIDRRILNTYGDGVGVEINLAPYIKFEVIRGHDATSAPIEDLGFSVYVADFQ